MKRFLATLLILGVPLFTHAAEAGVLKITTFQADVTPPIGAPLCAGAVKPAEAIDDPLSSRGVVLLPEGQSPIVLCAVDWVGIANGSWDGWRMALAEAVGTTANRVTVHVLHQHDAPFADKDTEDLLAPHGLAGKSYDVAFSEEAISRTAAAAKASIEKTSPVTHVGHGQAKVDRVASNRRVLGKDGKVEFVRWTATKDPVVRARGEGTIDPFVKVVSFWNGEQPLAVMSYYATHPQSHYGQGHVSADFVGMARSLREETLPGVPHLHFNGAGGNISAGKYNDGTPENRPVLAGRLAEGMEIAWYATEKRPVTAEDVVWKTLAVAMPPRPDLSRSYEEQMLANAAAPENQRVQSAREIAWLNRVAPGGETKLSLLRLGGVDILHMPGELFIEYQLAAQAMKPGGFVAMAAYGDYASGYICTEEAYPQGGYEAQLYVSRTAPETEKVLMDGMKKLLE